jgi:hypothetical protein
MRCEEESVVARRIKGEERKSKDSGADGCGVDNDDGCARGNLGRIKARPRTRTGSGRTIGAG